MNTTSTEVALLRHQTGFNKLFLKFMGVTPFEGGPIDIPKGATRLLSGYSSAYLVPIGNQEFLLVDAGADPAAAQLIGELHRQQVDATAVKAILLTHGHADHIGGCNQFPDAKIYIGQQDVPIVKGEEASDDLVGKMTGKQTKTALRNPAQLVVAKDGETLTIGDKQVKVFSVPGHTKGSLAYLIDNALFIGDALTFDTKGRVQKPPKPVSNDLDIAFQSLMALVARFKEENIRPDVIIPHHSGSGDFESLEAYVTNPK